MARYTRVFLDADDTLLDFGASEHEALHEAMALFGLPFPEEAERYYRSVNAALWKRYEQGGITQDALCVERFRLLLTRLGKDPEAAERLNDAYAGALSRSSILLPGALAFCRRASERFPLYILTNGVSFIQERRIGLSPIAPYLSGVFISQRMGYQKPRREFFEAVFGALGMTDADRRQAVMIGDSLSSDVLGGSRAGMKTVWCNVRGRPARADIVPDREIHDLRELTEFL